jgi:N-methylhydantoinase A
MYRVGIDTGGTNTDVVMTNVETGEIFSTKTPTTPKDLLEGIKNGINKIVSIAGINAEEIKELIYGTTIVVNMIAQKEEEATALITTRGFRDVLEIGRAYRNENIYDIFMEKPEPLVRRDLRFEVTERINFRGEIVEPLSVGEVKDIIGILKAKGIKSVAVCLLHSYANPVHERMIKEVIHSEWPEVYVSISSDINPQFREYERTSTTVINAYMMPNMVSHLVQFEKEMEENSISSKLYIMQGNAGVMTFKTAVEKPVCVADSGPIAGIIAANYLGKMAGINNIITLDMGGTSCDVSLIQNNTLKFTTDSHIEGYPISIPTVDLDFIGAGGGSIAWYDQGGALKVGPISAGALPGPVCYGRGGTEPTVTDANLVTGRIRPEIFLEDLSNVMEKTKDAIYRKIAKPLNMDLMEAAEGILQVVNSNMIRAIKLVSVERGYDPREFTLIAFGGAGALHAAKLAEEMEIPRVVIPYSPGTFSALGLVLADIKHDYVHTKLQSQEQVNVDDLNSIYAELEQKGVEELRNEGVAPEDSLLLRTCDIRYFGQAFELSVPLPHRKLTEKDIEGIAQKFHQIHERAYGHAMPEDPIEFVNYRVSAIGQMKKPNLGEDRIWETGIERFDKKMGTVIFDGKQYSVPIYDRNSLDVGIFIEGPAIIGEMGSTVIVYPGQKATIDKFRNVVIYTNC